MENLLWSVLGSLIVLALSVLFAWLRDRYALDLSRRDPRLPSIFLNTVLVLWIIFGGSLFYFIIAQNMPLLWMLPIFGVWSLVNVLYLWQRRNELRIVGVRGADRQIKRGIDYKKSLRLCHNELSLLGIGAAKLTAEAEFEKAIMRCRQEKPIRFLLCKPTHDLLIEAAKRSGRSDEAYQKIVKDSLRRIATLRARYPNIQVRFYSEFQILRLMFIDDSVCLISYNVMGEGDGSQLPQLHVCKPSQTERVVNSFYYPLQIYFEQLWDESDTWDFKDYLS
jgi:hypothetical protein